MECVIAKATAEHCDEPDTDKCIGCRGLTLVSEISEFGYCESCEYEDGAKQDNLTDR